LVSFGEVYVTLELLTYKEYPARRPGAGKMKHILSLSFNFGTNIVYTEMYIVRGEIEHIYISYQNISRWQIILLKILYLNNDDDSVKTC